ncbi:MAG: hypothetical protein VB078_02340 [Clostridiaceae bacterium]|nr:hypothetical protein [Clostridiaceae bacterium]
MKGRLMGIIGGADGPTSIFVGRSFPIILIAGIVLFLAAAVFIAVYIRNK